MKARRVDILDETHPRITVDSKPSSSSYVAVPRSSPAVTTDTNKSRLQCNFCKNYGHLKEACQRLDKQKNTKDSPSEVEHRVSSVTCFGCGAPGFIRSNCPSCKEKKPAASSINPFGPYGMHTSQYTQARWDKVSHATLSQDCAFIFTYKFGQLHPKWSEDIT